MKSLESMIAALASLIGEGIMEPLDERFVYGISAKTKGGEIKGTLPDRDVMAVTRLYSKYCAKDK